MSIISKVTNVIFVLFAISTISLFTIGLNCYNNVSHPWIYDSQQCLNIYSSSIVMFFVLCIILLFCLFIRILDIIDSYEKKLKNKMDKSIRHNIQSPLRITRPRSISNIV